jgi:hypothetical protein
VPRSNGTPEIDVFDIFASAETTTVYLDPERRLWVRLLNELDFGQQSELDAASIRGVTMQEATAATQEGRLMVFDLGHQRRLKLSLYIDDWGLPHKWPAKTDERYQLVKRLKPRWATLILEQIERLERVAAGEQSEESVQDTDPNLLTLPSRAIESAAT